MFGRIYAIALNTFRESMRNRIVYGIVLLAIILNVSALFFKEMSYHEQERIVKDTGLAGISLFGGITAILLGVTMLYNELKKRTVHTILSKPIARHEFILGKYLGLALMLSFLVGLFAVTMAFTLWVSGFAFDSIVWKATLLHYMEVMVVAAFAVFFSAFASPYLSGIFTASIWFLGRTTDFILLLVETREKEAASHGESGDFFSEILTNILRLLPDLNLFSPSSRTIVDANGEPVHWTIHGQFVGWDYVVTQAGYAALWIAGSLIFATVIFRRRDFV